MNIFVYPPGSSSHVQLTRVQHVSIWDDNGALLFDYENAGTPAPIDPPVTPPTTPPAGQYPTPVPPVVIPWPVSGQVVLHVSLDYNQTVCYRLVWASSMDPNKSGFVKISEQPGSAVMPRILQLNNNGVQKFITNESAPTGNLVNAPTPGSPSQVMMAYGDTLDIIITNGDRPLGGANGNILVDIAVPDRY